MIGRRDNRHADNEKAAYLKDEICLCTRWQVLGYSTGLPKLCDCINDPVVFLEEERMHWGQRWLYNGSCVPAGEIGSCWVRIPIFRGWLWACKSTLTSAWKSFVTSGCCVSTYLGSQPGTRKGFSSKSFIYSESHSYFLSGSIDVAAVNKSCYPIYLLPRISILWTENVRPESGLWHLVRIKITLWMGSMVVLLFQLLETQQSEDRFWWLEYWSISSFLDLLSIYPFSKSHGHNTPALRNINSTYIFHD